MLVVRASAFSFPHRLLASAAELVTRRTRHRCQVAHLNQFCDRTQAADPMIWGIRKDRQGYHINQGLICAPPAARRRPQILC